MKTAGLVKTTANNPDTDLIALGANVGFNKRDDQYQTYAMTVKDFADSLKTYKVYTALLSQIGTDDPVATVLENTIGDIVWTRIGVGNFRGTLASAFTLNKTIAFPEADIQQTPNMSVLTFGTIDENTVVIQSLNNLIIGDEFAGWIEIRVYN